MSDIPCVFSARIQLREAKAKKKETAACKARPTSRNGGESQGIWITSGHNKTGIHMGSQKFIPPMNISYIFILICGPLWNFDPSSFPPWLTPRWRRPAHRPAPLESRGGPGKCGRYVFEASVCRRGSIRGDGCWMFYLYIINYCYILKTYLLLYKLFLYVLASNPLNDAQYACWKFN